MPALLRPGGSETWAQPQREALECAARRPQGHRPGADIVPLTSGLARPRVRQRLPVTPGITSPGDTGPDTMPKPESCPFCQLPSRDVLVPVQSGWGIRGRNLPQVTQQCGGTAEVSSRKGISWAQVWSPGTRVARAWWCCPGTFVGPRPLPGSVQHYLPPRGRAVLRLPWVKPGSRWAATEETLAAAVGSSDHSLGAWAEVLVRGRLALAWLTLCHTGEDPRMAAPPGQAWPPTADRGTAWEL